MPWSTAQARNSGWETLMPPSISIGLAAARQAAAIGPQLQNPSSQSQARDTTTARAITPAKPLGTGLLVDTRA